MISFSKFDKFIILLLYSLFFQPDPVVLDSPLSWQIGFQDPATPYMEGITDFHDTIMFFIVMILVFVSWLLVRTINLFSSTKNPEIFTHSTLLEVVWTTLPAIILIIISIPSFALLYSLDEAISPSLTLKVVGHQWYWSYEYSDYEFEYGYGTLNFDSYMTSEDDLNHGSFRLLEVDNRVILPTNTYIRVLITAADVLHSWAIPSLGVKVDACPGRLNQIFLYLKREGVYYGQCSEICGVHHGFMPIIVQGIDLKSFIKWLKHNLEENA